jgi:uncharacterized protein YyaL (SSP411 family)
VNRLANEISPYLKQHAENPVDWFPWGDEAFSKASEENLPILLSIGYSTCHWCHVMAHESFENDSIAELMNSNFVNIKVDREERPDIDSVYMTYTQALTGQGGWPMTVFLTPDKKPFYAGTYFPPTDNHGRPGFSRLLESISKAWQENRSEIEDQAADITAKIIQSTESHAAHQTKLHREVSDQAVEALSNIYDSDWGGFGNAPKFPSPANLEFLLAYGSLEKTASKHATEMAVNTLEQMLSGGLYDQLGGGFARYSVDRTWLAPHFEKMLYDNASLIKVLTQAHQVAPNKSRFPEVIHETIAYLEREMCLQINAEEIAFYSAQDADSEGIEGKFFLWTTAQLEEALGMEDALIAAKVFDVSMSGNFIDPHNPELVHRNILTRRTSISEIAKDLQIENEELSAKVNLIRARLFEVRKKRIPPDRDEKILTSWNGLLIGGLAEAGRVFENQRYIENAEKTAQFIYRNLWVGESKNSKKHLMHIYAEGQAKVLGQLEDYSYLGLGLIDLYRATGKQSYLNWSRELFNIILNNFHDEKASGFFDTSTDAESLIIRPKSIYDASIPAGNGSAAKLGAILGRYFNNDHWLNTASEAASLAAASVQRGVSALGTSLQAILHLTGENQEIAIVGDPKDRRIYEHELARSYLPLMLVALTSKDEISTHGPLDIFTGREAYDSPVTAYICRDMVCNIPAKSINEFKTQLAELKNNAS